MIVAGLRNYNKLIQSGSADIIFKMSQYDSQERQLDSLVSKRRITFSGLFHREGLKKRCLESVEIPDDAEIWISDLSKYLPKEEYLKLYGSAFNEK